MSICFQAGDSECSTVTLSLGGSLTEADCLGAKVGSCPMLMLHSSNQLVLLLFLLVVLLLLWLLLLFIIYLVLLSFTIMS